MASDTTGGGGKIRFLLHTVELAHPPSLYLEFMPAFHPGARFELRPIPGKRYGLAADLQGQTSPPAPCALTRRQAKALLRDARHGLSSLLDTPQANRKEIHLTGAKRITTFSWGPSGALDGIDFNGLVQDPQRRELWLFTCHAPPHTPSLQALMVPLWAALQRHLGEEAAVEDYLVLLRRYYQLPLPWESK